MAPWALTILVPIVFHLAANLGNEIFRTQPDTKAIQTGLLVVLSAVVVWRERELFFAQPRASTFPSLVSCD